MTLTCMFTWHTLMQTSSLMAHYLRYLPFMLYNGSMEQSGAPSNLGLQCFKEEAHI